jgi:hypothetical protein
VAINPTHDKNVDGVELSEPIIRNAIRVRCTE